MAKKRGLSWQQYRLENKPGYGLWIAYFNGDPIAQCESKIGVLPPAFKRHAIHISQTGMTPQEAAERRAKIENRDII